MLFSDALSVLIRLNNTDLVSGSFLAGFVAVSATQDDFQGF